MSDDEFEERFVRSSGPGGQHVNKVSSAVQLVHKPTGLSVTVQESRSQAENRRIAYKRLRALIERTREEQAARRRHLREKKRRQRRKPSKAAKRRMVESKRRRSEVKRLRKGVGEA